MTGSVKDKDIKSFIDQLVEKVIPAPENLSKLIAMLKRDNVSVIDISRELALDPVLAADTLRMVNSAYFGFSKEIKSLEQAVVILGTKALLRLVIAAWAKKISLQELKNFKVREGELAIFSLVGAYAATKFADIAGLKFASDIIFTAGALRTLGRVVLNFMGANIVNNILKEVFENKRSFHSATKIVAGMSHSEIASYLLRRWKIPEDLATIVHFYPSPSEFSGDISIAKMISCVHLGDIVAMQIGEGAPLDSMLYTVDRKAFDILGLKDSRDYIGDVCAMMLEDIQKLKDTFKISVGI